MNELQKGSAALTPPTAHRDATRDAQAPWRWREREWVWLALAVCAVCLLFAAWPSLDLWLSAAFYQVQGGFVGQRWLAVRVVYESVPWFGRACGLVALVLAVTCWRRPGFLGVRWWRRTLALGLAMLLGTGLMVNGVLKESWGRARPVALQAFGGSAVFAPALRPSDQCRTNCSFVSGHAATGFTLLAVGLFGAPRTRRRWLVVGLVAGLVVGGVRVVQGGHFLSDVLFSGLVVWLCAATQRELWLRVVARRRRLAVLKRPVQSVQPSP